MNSINAMKPNDLQDHPEGGRFQEVFRSEKVITTQSGRERSALTHIYFELKSGERSRFHLVSSDEIWNLYRGEGLRLYLWDGEKGSAVQCVTLSQESEVFCHVVPAGVWQAAESCSGEVLVGCSVAPGFQFEDFVLIDPKSEEAETLKALDLKMERFI